MPCPYNSSVDTAGRWRNRRPARGIHPRAIERRPMNRAWSPGPRMTRHARESVPSCASVVLCLCPRATGWSPLHRTRC